MSTLDTSGKVIDLTVYRSKRMAGRTGPRPRVRYVLWYPGIGYLLPPQPLTPIGAAKAAKPR